MDIRTFAIIAAGCTCIVAAAYAGTTDRRDRPSAGGPVPSIKKNCTTCHLPTETATVGKLKKKPSALCLDCHSDRMAPAEHKVDIVPKIDVRGLPLVDGKITCITCHDPHENAHGSMLRLKAGDLCLVCHPR